MSQQTRGEDAAYTELSPDSWHQNDEGNYYIDCPECGSAASLMNVVKHGRCNGYLDQQNEETELDEETMDCTAKLWLELGYVSDPSGESAGDEADGSGGDGEDVTDEEGVPASEEPPGTDGTVETDQ